MTFNLKNNHRSLNFYNNLQYLEKDHNYRFLAPLQGGKTGNNNELLAFVQTKLWF